MVRNNKRRAFTIVELVIVIAVIAILAAVMIPTFGGIIKKANISADTQIAASMNTQLSIYKAEGNKIETEADLWNALSSDADFTSQLDPKSAKHGYHYWYDAEKNEIKLLPNEQVLAERTQPAMNAGGDEIATPFAYAAPRLINGFYLLDKVADDKSTNDIAKFFDVIEKMGEKTKADYQQAITDLEALKNSNKNDNQALADAILARISKTAVMTDKGAFINTDNDKNKEINFIYIPAAPTGATNYYLNHTVNHATDAEITDLLDLVKVAEGSVIEIPEGVKIAEGTLVPFGNIVVKVDVENAGELANVFSAGAVIDGVVVQVNGVTHTVNGNKIMQGETVVATLAYRNPVKSFDVSARDNVAILENANYIALDTIRSGINLTLTTSNFKGNDETLPVYEEVVWTADDAGIEIDADGKVKFNNKDTFNKDSITFTATAVAANGTPATNTFTVTVLKLTGATINFFSGANTGSQDIVSDSTHAPNDFIVDYESQYTTAKFTVSDFMYNNLDFGADIIAQLGISTPTATFTADGTYFTVGGENHEFTFVYDNIKLLVGTIGTQNVAITLSDNTGAVFSSSITVTVNDNTNTPFEVAIPSYDNGHIYQVGNGNTLSLGELFKEKKEDLNLSEYKVHIYTTQPRLDLDNYYHFETTPIATFENPAVETLISFANQTGNCWVVLATVSGENGTDEDGEEIVIEGIAKLETITSLQVNVVAANNISANEFTDLGAGTHAQHTFSTNVVLHNNLTFAGASDKPVIVLSNGADLYANYFTIKAEKFVDTTGATSDGYSFMKTSANSIINNLILQGPTYPTFGTPNDGTGYFCFGIITEGNKNEIKDSYLYGFLSPVRVHGNVEITISGTTLEGGTWSNLWINTANTVNLTNVTTIQNHKTGYTPTLGDTSKKILGMGIYINDDLAARADATDKVEMTINLNGVKQYNWIPQNLSGFGGNVDLGKDIIFNVDDNGNFVYDSKFFHPADSTYYVNAAIVYQCLDLSIVKTEEEYCIEDEDCNGWDGWGRCSHTKGKRWVVNDTLTSWVEKLGSSLAGAKNMPTIQIVWDQNMVNNNTIKYNQSALNDDTFRIAYRDLNDAMRAAIKNKVGDAGSILDTIISLFNPQFGLDVYAAAPMHTENCTICSGDLDEVPNGLSEFKPVTKYNDGSDPVEQQ